MLDFQLVPFSINHISESIVIYNHEFGQGYFSFNQIEKISSGRNFLGYSIINKSTKKVLGVCIGYHSYPFEINSETFLVEKYVYLKSIAVTKDFHTMGIGKLLLNEFIKSADNLKQGIYTTVWVKENEASVFESMLIKSKFDLHSEHLNYWKEKSVIEKFECKKCGNPPCTCAMRVYFKNNVIT